jgi:hypothetical protein
MVIPQKSKLFIVPIMFCYAVRGRGSAGDGLYSFPDSLKVDTSGEPNPFAANH